MEMTPELERALLALVKRADQSRDTEDRVAMLCGRHGLPFTKRDRAECYDKVIDPALRVARIVKKHQSPPPQGTGTEGRGSDDIRAGDSPSA